MDAAPVERGMSRPNHERKRCPQGYPCTVLFGTGEEFRSAVIGFGIVRPSKVVFVNFESINIRDWDGEGIRNWRRR
jgi:hypothetical protein